MRKLRKDAVSRWSSSWSPRNGSIHAGYNNLISQHNPNIQEQVVDMQRNARATIFRMVREIRMAGFGRVAGEFVPGVGYISRVLPVQFTGTKGETIIYRNILNRDTPEPGWLTVIAAVNSGGHIAELLGVSSRFQIVVDKVNVEKDPPFLDNANKRYISIDGVGVPITRITEETTGTTKQYLLDLEHPLQYHYKPGAQVSPITAVSFQLGGREEIGSGRQPMAENIESVTFGYFDDHGNATLDDKAVRMVHVVITARTERPDPSVKEKEGYRRREIASNIQIRNLALVP
jgi:hypothetical protein